MSQKRKNYIALMRGAMYVCSGLTAALLLFLLGYVLYKGIPNISWEFLSTKPSHLTERIGILPDILNTVYIVLATLVIVLPLGVGAAIYLTEYAQPVPKRAFPDYGGGQRDVLFQPRQPAAQRPVLHCIGTVPVHYASECGAEFPSETG